MFCEKKTVSFTSPIILLLYQHLAFMYKLNKNKAPLTFNKSIKKPFHKYPTKSFENCFSLKAVSLKSTKYCISFSGPKIWNKFLTKEEKELQSFSFFKNILHSKLLEDEHELEYFWIKLLSHNTNLAITTVKYFRGLMIKLSAFSMSLSMY